MRSKNSRCIVLSSREYGPNDKLVFLYSEDFGKITTIAKGAKRLQSRFTGHLETLSVANCQLYFGPKNILITEITSKNLYTLDNLNLKSAISALQISEILNQLLYENQQIIGLSHLIEETIKKIPSCQKPLLLSIQFIIKFLDLIGLMPNFHEINFDFETKYLKFFEYIKKESLPKILKIKLKQEEELRILDFLKQITENLAQATLLTFTTPFTFSSLSKSESKLAISFKSSIK